MHVVWRLTLGSVCLQIAALAAAEGRKAPMMLAVIYDELVRLVCHVLMLACVRVRAAWGNVFCCRKSWEDLSMKLGSHWRMMANLNDNILRRAKSQHDAVFAKAVVNGGGKVCLCMCSCRVSLCAYSFAHCTGGRRQVQ